MARWINGLVLGLIICFLSQIGLASQEMIVDKFSITDEGKLPAGWRARNRDLTEKARSVYKVVVEGENAYLLAHSKGEAVQLGKKIEIDLKEFPILKWRWRVDKLCQGGDERHKDTGDSPAGIYVVFPSWKKWNPKAIKYVWSASKLPKGFITKSPYASGTKIIVLENANSPLGKWVEERVDVRSDYKKFWGKKLKKIKLIGIMTDSDNTKKEAIAAYDDIIMQGEDQ